VLDTKCVFNKFYLTYLTVPQTNTTHKFLHAVLLGLAGFSFLNGHTSLGLCHLLLCHEMFALLGFYFISINYMKTKSIFCNNIKMGLSEVRRCVKSRAW
jgi:hypothetical protein